MEHNADEIWQRQYNTLLRVLDQAGVSLEEIAAIGITNQRETTVVWDKKRGSHWQCHRGKIGVPPMCQEWIEKGMGRKVKIKNRFGS